MSIILEEQKNTKLVLVSIIIPVYNCYQFIDECFESILSQQLQLSPPKAYSSLEILETDSALSASAKENKSPFSKYEKVSEEYKLRLELSVFEDGSTDGTSELVDKWIQRFQLRPNDFSVQISKNSSGAPKGVGFGRNQAIRQSSGEYLCFCDADDVMESNRIITQYFLAQKHPNALVGSRFKRIPEDSTKNFTTWANNLTETQLMTQIYLTFGPTVLMPTWFCNRAVYEKIHGGFDESGKGTPEDLIFFYKHLDTGNPYVVRADEILMTYRYHSSATTFSVSDARIRELRLERLEAVVLSQWTKFTIWNAGKSGRRLYRSLKPENQKKVSAFCDVDEKKLKQKSYHPYPLKINVPIIHPKDACSPFIICVKTELIWDEEGSEGTFRRILDNLNLTEGKDFFYFN